MTVVVNDAEWKRLQAKLAKLPGMRVHVGVLSDKGGSASHSESGLTIVELAAVHEFGTDTVPERSFIRSAFKRRDPELTKLLAKLGRAILNDTMSQAQALGVLGTWAEARVKAGIVTGDGIAPELADSTVAAKKSSRPLVDDGQLLNAITHKVVTR